jgi:hypothetical protein
VKDSTAYSTKIYKLTLKKDSPTNLKAGFMCVFLTVVYFRFKSESDFKRKVTEGGGNMHVKEH